jgi:hypothetical protein
MLGGGIVAERNYSKDSKNVTVTFAMDSPLLQSFAMVLSNPMFATADGGKMTRIDGQKAVVKYDDSSKSGEINLIVANRVLVTVKGDQVDQADLTEYAKSVAYQNLSALAAN